MARRYARWPNKWATKNTKDRCRCWQNTNLCVFRWKIRHEANSRRKLGESIWRKYPNCGMTHDNWIAHIDSSPVHGALRVCEIHCKNGPPTVLTWLNPQHILALSEIKKKSLKEQRFVGMPDIQCNMMTLLKVFWKTIFKAVYGSGTVVSWSSHKESILKVTAASNAQVS